MLAATGNPDLLIATLALGGLLCVFIWRVIVWVREAPVTPDPWDTETNDKLSDPEIEQACHHCSTPQKCDAWFCPHCGNAVGPYNNLMPFIYIFSEGEVYRNVVNQRFRNRPLVAIGVILMVLGPMMLFFISIHAWLLGLITLYYLFTVFRNLSAEEKSGQD